MSCSSADRDNEARAVACTPSLRHEPAWRSDDRDATHHSELVEDLSQIVRVHVAVGDGYDPTAVGARPVGPKMRQSRPELLVQPGQLP